MSAWKACDIRGVFPAEVSPPLFASVGWAVAAQLPPGARVLVAGDFRASTPVLKTALTEGLRQAGARVLDAGLLPTPVAYFAHRLYGTDAVLIVTASHNPAGHNGLKLMIGALPPTVEELEELRARSLEAPPARAPGAVETVSPVAEYRRWILERWSGFRPDAGLTVVLDAGNGAWSELAPPVFEALGFRVHRLFCEIDGRFPNRAPDSARAENLGALAAKVVETHSDLGIAWDGDGDRVSFADATGEILTADQMAVLLIGHLLRAGTGDRVIYDLKLSDAVRRAILEKGGTPLMERSGHTFLKRGMIERGCLFGCEASGHYFFRELAGGDDGLFSALLVASMARLRPLEERRRALPPLHITPDLRLRRGDPDCAAISERLRTALRPSRETALDGVRMETREGIVLVRDSVTERAVTMRMEASDAQALAGLIAKCMEALPENAAEIASALRTRNSHGAPVVESPSV